MSDRRNGRDDDGREPAEYAPREIAVDVLAEHIQLECSGG